MNYWLRVAFFSALAIAILAFIVWVGISTEGLNPLARFVVIAILIGLSVLSLPQLKL
ncbi:Copper-transporting ATPase CopB (plasmid) [Mesorhizobium loti]|nr:Copper-transporting ATPase CopB [Mesorhizobium loti]